MNFFFILPVVSSEILVRYESGTAFARSEEKTYFYMDAKRVKLNILRPSPRVLLGSSDYTECNKNLNNYCDQLFQTFDEEILEFLNLNLVKKLRKSSKRRPNECTSKHPYPYFSGKWCCASTDERSGPVDAEWAKLWGIETGDGSCDGSGLSMHSKCCDGP